MSDDPIVFDLPDPFVQERTVTETEIDRLGHANNAVYLRWCEESGWGHTEKVGCSFPEWEQLGRAMAVYRVSLEYRAACAVGDELAVAVWLVANDERLRATRRFQIVRRNDRRTVFRGEIVYACIDLATGRARRMPEEFKRAYAVLPSVASALAASRR